MAKKKCVKCDSYNCTGFYLLHPKELTEVKTLTDAELEKNPEATFKLIRSTNKDGGFDGCSTKFMELHVIIKEED